MGKELFVLYYIYDQTNGRLLATIRDGVGTSYTYTTLGRLKGAKPAAGLTATYTPTEDAENVSYTYNSYGELATITTDSTTYTFTYDSFGNSTSVRARDNTLATYEYKENNGKLIKVIYGNGYFEEYVQTMLILTTE